MSTSDLTAPDVEGVTVSENGALGLITLNRPQVLNVLNTPMKARLAEAFPAFARNPDIYAAAIEAAGERAFCAGGDVRESVSAARSDMPAARVAFKREYELIWLLECFSKPTVSLISGIVMGSGVGLTAFNTHRVAGERYKFAMPETAIGLFPDVGIAYVLARLPHEIGTYLGLTGRAISRSDAFKLGLATHCIPESEFDAIKAGLSEAWPVDTLLDERHSDPGPGELEPYNELIAKCFATDTVEEIIGRLKAASGPHAEWAQAVVADLEKQAPLSLKVTLRHIREARAMDLRQTLGVDYKLACRFLEDSDFREGVRAVLIDKDNKPNWQPADLSGVTAEMVAHYFSQLTDDGLDLPTRSEMQAARV
ncbi:Enoyl-CoA hydratase [Candidatus Filomicrobium marinum]|uniref:3-hydroxyisobutyryl-CoA hydrolase n=1 Tax=Candidatus Filomicrobium marinum TaxID=1608628 RepID=A0A0D6JHK7_9HYPH|nr:enoyl-CoA hydratase/isomerase family protein [Candidatus Filomicrobium marinum]CFX49279.1 Enoyl-CoA hydratase [Candidatus Filomicrobium marinum]CPR20354.1 Enoyl-CoA hydratase [Candidatus Filomicrobium marinum]